MYTVQVTPETSELLQTLAFKYNWLWNSEEKKIQYTEEARTLSFREENKRINCAPHKVNTTIDEMIEILKYTGIRTFQELEQGDVFWRQLSEQSEKQLFIKIEQTSQKDANAIDMKSSVWIFESSDSVEFEGTLDMYIPRE